MSSSKSSSTYLTGLVALAVSVAAVKAFHYYKESQSRLRDKQRCDRMTKNSSFICEKVTILFGTTTGTAKSFAQRISRALTNAGILCSVQNISSYDEDKLSQEDVVLFITSTWMNGKPPDSCKLFFEWLEDYVHDFRVSKDHLKKLRYSVFGLGGALYSNNYCKAVKLSLLFPTPL